MDTNFQTYLIGRLDTIRDTQVVHGLEVSEILRLVREAPKTVTLPALRTTEEPPASRWKPLALKVLTVCLQSAGGVYAIFLALKSGDAGTALSLLGNLLSSG